MRSAFDGAVKSATHWFPGHMAKGLKDMQVHIQRCSALLEVHDARVPISGRNPRFDLFANKPRLVLLNKVDLADPALLKATEACYAARGEAVMFVNCLQQHSKDIRLVLPRVLALLGPAPPEPIKLMCVGMPNVGKSSLLNALRRSLVQKKNCAKVGDEPGVTRAVQQEVLLSESPRVYLIDTPGIMIPNLDNSDVAMKLALVGTMKDDMVGEELLADFLLFTLNKHGQFRYVKDFGLLGPTDNIDEVLLAVAKRIGALRAGGIPDDRRAALHFLFRFRAGHLGRINLDSDVMPTAVARTAGVIETN